MNDQEAFLELFDLIESKADGTLLSAEEELQILDLCRREPRLFCEHLNHDQGLFLLNILIRFGVSLNTLEAFFQFHSPESVLNCRNGEPLHQACACENTQPGVIPFLLKQYPSDANIMGFNEQGTGNRRAHRFMRMEDPIGWLLQRSSNVLLEDVQALMSVEDVMLHYSVENKQGQLIELVVKGVAGLPVLEYLIGKFTNLTSFRIMDVPLCMRQAQLLSLLLTAAQLKTFQLHLCYSEVELQALLTLMEQGIGEAYHLRYLHLDFTDDHDVIPPLRHRGFDDSSDDDDDEDYFDDQIVIAEAEDEVAQDDNIIVGEDNDTNDDVVPEQNELRRETGTENGTTEETEVADTSRTNDDPHSDREPTIDSTLTSMMGNLVLSEGEFNVSSLEGESRDVRIATAMQSSLLAAPSLSSLTLLASKDKHPWANNSNILSETMAALLRRNRIERLVINKNIALDHEPIWEALKQNTSLRHLDIESCVDKVAKCESLVAILEDYNTSIHHVPVIDWLGSPKDKRRILYFVHLNMVGRSKARFSGNVRPEFLDLLLKADQLDALIHSQHTKPTPEQYLYGMLRESPGSWCR